MRKSLFLFVLIFSFTLFARDDGRVELEFNGDSLTIWHYSAWRNCGACYTMDLYLENSTFYLFENDSSSNWLRCMCYFDLATTITVPPPGQYSLVICTTNKVYSDTTLVADTTFTIAGVPLISFSYPECLNNSAKSADDVFTGIEIPLVNHYESGCEGSVYPDLYAASYDENVELIWYADSINCDIIPEWHGHLSNDTLHVSLNDAGPQNQCLCPQYFHVTFGPLPAGKYVLDFMAGEFGYPVFIVDEQVVVEVSEQDLILYWDIADLNCCLEPQWDGWLEGNSFHVTMTDVGLQCDCLCPFELSARFGPFPPGDYTLDFRNTSLGPFEFTIIASTSKTSIEILSSYQSGCYDAVAVQLEAQKPGEYALLHCYPNPFNPVTTIMFSLPAANEITIDVYDISGALVRNVFVGSLAAGEYTRNWDASDSPSGIYFVRLNGENLGLTHKVLLLK